MKTISTKPSETAAGAAQVLNPDLFLNLLARTGEIKITIKREECGA
jgi:hypothetical protein